MRVLSKLKKPKATRILGGALGLLLVLSLVLLPAVPVLAVEPPPHWFYGTVTIGTELAPEGTIVSAQIDGVQYGDPTLGESYGTVVGAEGKYGYDPLFKVPADDPETPKDGGEAGDIVEFYITNEALGLDSVKANETVDFEVWGSTLLPLTVTIADTTAPTVTITALTPDPSNVNTPTFTGTATDTESNISSVDYKVDGEEWTAADASDGAFDSLSEEYTFTTAVLLDGTHTVYVRATDTEMNTSTEPYASDEFTIDTEAPTAIVSPVADAPDVAVNAVVSATFDEDVTAFDSSGITITGATGVLATLEGTDTIAIAHDDFASLTSYTVTIPAGAVEDLAGNSNAEISWSFTSVTITFIITASAGANGTIDPEGAVEVIEGTDQLFTIAPAEGYEILDVLVDDVSVGPVATYTFLAVDAIHTIDASFAEIPPITFIITASAGANGTIDPEGAVEVIEGTDQLFTIAPAEGYEILDVLVDDTSALADVTIVEGVGTYTFLDVAAIHTITASFELIQLSTEKAITSFDFEALDPAVVGVVDEAAKTIDLIVPFGTDVAALVPTIVITGVSVAPASGVAQDFISPVDYTVTAEDASTAVYGVTVTVAPATYALTMLADPVIGGTATDLTGLSPYEEGGSVSIKAVAEDGYRFVEWTATAGEFVDASEEQTTFTMPGQDVTVTANFEETDLVITTISLASGWNLISLPLIPEDPAILIVLDGVDVAKVAGYSPFQEWKYYTPGFTSNLEQMNDGWGYWVDMGTTTATLTVSGYEYCKPPPAVPPSYYLVEGWNLIGFKSLTNILAGTYLDELEPVMRAMYGYDTTSGLYTVIEATDDLVPGNGYWLAVSEDGTIYP